jgi:hypothetical protein
MALTTTDVISPLAQFDDRWLDGLDFCRLVYEFFEKVRTGPNGVAVLRERKRVVKKLLEELLPICRYVQANYGAGKYMSVRWLNGSQPFDAQIETKGAFVDNGGWPSLSALEVTGAVHQNDHLMREMLNAGGPVFGVEGIEKTKDAGGNRQIVSKPTSYLNQSYIDTFKKIILAAVKAKVRKKYPSDTTLIVDCSLHTVFMRDEWEELVRRVRLECPKHEFREIFLSDGARGFSAVL